MNKISKKTDNKVVEKNQKKTETRRRIEWYTEQRKLKQELRDFNNEEY